MYLDEAVRFRLKDLMQEKGFTPYKLYREGGIPRATVSQVLSGKNGKIKVETLYQFVATMGMTLGEFFTDPIFEEIAD